MSDASFFTQPTAEWQRRYEALRAAFVDRLPDRLIAERFKYSPGYVSQLRFKFRHGMVNFSEPDTGGRPARRKVSKTVREDIVQCRRENLSAGEIAEVLLQGGVELSIRTVERVLAEEGFPKLPRRTQLRIGRTVKGAEVPEKTEVVRVASMDGARFESDGAGVFLFAPFLAQLDIGSVVRKAKLPESRVIPAMNYFLSILALKLLGTERYAHVGDHSFDPGLGLFAGLNVLPKCTALSTYSYSLDQAHINRLQEAFVGNAYRLGVYDKNVVNLDFHTVPHFGDESVLETHWAGARSKRMKGALTMFAQDSETKLIVYTAADIQRSEADDQILSFLPYWAKISRQMNSTLVFDSKFTTYKHLSELNKQSVKFITLRRRGSKLLEEAEKAGPWSKITVPHEKRKYPNPIIHESTVELLGYDGVARQIILKGNGHEKPAFLITNDFASPAELLVSNYSCRWHIETGISEAVKFFHINALSSPILLKVHFDMAMTMIADTLYWRLAQNLRGFEKCDANTIYRNFVHGNGIVGVRGNEVTVTYPKRAHNPILRAVSWKQLPDNIPWLDGAKLTLTFG
ncbi:MAG: transposase [Peptococcaceae bacterium]|jgi:transposase|nr:transposase [Peptococcaceae bacterium]